MKIALQQAREKGLLGNSILGSSFAFDIEVFQGSGAFVCGEASALVNSMEGKMGIPEPASSPGWLSPVSAVNPLSLTMSKPFAKVR